MIKKVIHYCWLSEDPFPAAIQRCIDSWHKILPDYEIRRWDFSRFPRGKSAWVDEAFDARKYAFASDYIRAYALYHEGGIYLDSDVEVIKSFDPLLHLPYFLCRENGTGNVEAAIMGSAPGNPVFARMLEYYDARHFRRPDGSLDTKPMPKVIDDVLHGHIRLVDIDTPDQVIAKDGEIRVLPFDWFSPINIETRRLEQTSRTIAIHRFAATWQPWHLRMKKRVKRILGPAATEALIKAKRRLRRR